MATIREACDAGDVQTLKQVAHKLAGGALNLGVTAAGRIAQQIELAADTGIAPNGCARLVADLDRALAEGRQAVLAYQAAYSEHRRRPGPRGLALARAGYHPSDTRDTCPDQGPT